MIGVESSDACLLEQQQSKLFSAIVDAQSICCIHDPDQGISLLKVIPPV